MTTQDLLNVAEGFGCATADVTTPAALQEAITEALGRPRPTVIRIAATAG